jgi:hypothetical protein
MTNQNISMLGRDAHMNSSESELCCNPLYQLYDPMSAISFMRKCISEPMNPGPLLIIRNNFPFTLSQFLFSVIINFENTKIFPLLHFTNQNTTTIYFAVYHCIIAYYFSLHIPTAKDFLAPLHLLIYLFSIAYLFLVLYTYTHLVLDNHLVKLRAQSKFILLCRLLEEGQEGSIYTQFPKSSI